MKTTVVIADGLYKQAKATAQKRGVPMRELIEDGLRMALSQGQAREKSAFRVVDASFPPPGAKGGERGMQEPYSWAQIRALIYAGRGGEE